MTIKEIARQDAKEYAEAKMNYGKGAGNRRKLIQAKVDSRMKDPEYRNAFQQALGEIDYEPIAERVKTKNDIREGVNVMKRGIRAGKRLYNIYDRNRDILEPIVRRIIGD